MKALSLLFLCNPVTLTQTVVGVPVRSAAMVDRAPHFHDGRIGA